MNGYEDKRFRYIAFKGRNIFRRYVHEQPDSAEVQPNQQYDEQMVHGSYGSLLFDPRWKSKRDEILQRDTHRCVICKGTENLHVHHRQYHFNPKTNQFNMPWEYENRLLITLCEYCHRKGHNKFKVPIIYI